MKFPQIAFGKLKKSPTFAEVHQSKSQEWWQVKNNQKEFLHGLAKSLKLKDWKEWYSITTDQIAINGGLKLLNIFRMRSPELIIQVLDEFPFKYWKFMQVLPSEWDTLQKQRMLFEDVSKELFIHKIEDWYNITKEQLHESGINRLIDFHFKGSIISALINLFPEYYWRVWKFANFSSYFFNEIQNQHAFMEDIAQQAGIQSFEDWYQLSSQKVIEMGGASLLAYYSGSLHAALCGIYPEYEWKAWKFSIAPKNFFVKEENIKEVLDWLAKKMDIQQLDDWYRIPNASLKYLGLSGLLSRYGSLFNVLMKIYPNHNWDYSRLKKMSFKFQNILFLTIQKLFPNVQDVHSEYSHPELEREGSQRKLIFDIFIPSLKLAFEYQGEQHFEAIDVFQNSGELAKIYDDEKRELCRKHGITLIEIPFWWDMSEESLKATIKHHRPELIPAHILEDPIPSQNPKKKQRNATLNNL